MRRIVIVLVSFLTSYTLFAQAPQGHVDLVNALVAQVAAAEVPEPVPVVVELLPPQRLHRGRADPQIVIHAARHRHRAGMPANAAESGQL